MAMSRLSRSVPALMLAAAAVALTGCGVYRTTSRTAGDIKSIAVPYFSNATSQPDIEIEITDRIIEGIVRDNTLRVVDESEADALLEGTVVEYQNVPFTFAQGETQIEAEQYRVFVGIRVSLFDKGKNAYLYENRTIKAHGDYYLETNVDQNYENAMDEVYRDLVEGILSATVQDW
jgi:hypothetical protein